MTGGLRTRAFAKVNLSLEVLGRRPDGFHEVRTILQTIALCDELEVVPASRESLQINGGQATGTPPDDSNLALRAIEFYRQATAAGPTTPRYALRLTKGIPVAAGFGGGSTDAAAVLRLMDSSAVRPLGPESLEQLAAQLGSDTAFFVRGGTQLASGRGEHLARLPDIAILHFVLLCPDLLLPAKTATLYALLTPELMSDGGRTERLSACIRAGSPLQSNLCVNVFDRVADRAFPALLTYRQALESHCGEAMLCGAGPSLFSLVPSADVAIRVAAELRGKGFRAFATRSVSAAETTGTER